MKITATVSIGKASYQFYIDESNEKEALHKAAVLGNPPDYCNECKNAQFFKLDSNKDKDGNIYVNVVCRKCGAKAKLGEYKSKGYFWHKFLKFQKEEPQPSTSEPNEADPSGIEDSENLPF